MVRAGLRTLEREEQQHEAKLAAIGLAIAEADLLGTWQYTLRAWGEAQAARYLDDLESCCQMLADNPRLGRLCENIRPGLRRLEHDKHDLFYREERGSVLISRILHQRILPDRHVMDEPEDEL